jgi:hypothetical protein
MCKFVFTVNFRCLSPRAVKQESPYDRMKLVVKWYLSGFYKKPKVRFLGLIRRRLSVLNPSSDKKSRASIACSCT